MKNRVFKVSLIILVMLFGALSVVNAASDISGEKKASKIYKASSTLEGGAKGDAWAISINNIHLPYNRKGIIADVNYQPYGSLGKYPGPSGKGFLFSSGFFLSGYRNGELFSNAVASASLVEDYIQGTVADGATDSRAQIYVVSADDPPFGAAWQEWKSAVELGADFWDGNGDGKYDPQDLNGNGEWDPDEDRPDLIGDELGWTVFNDGVESGSRRWNTVDPIGIEVRQSIFGFASAGAIGNIVFVRYRFNYVGLGKADDPDELTDVYFGVWADPDIGGTSTAAADDLVGSDINRNVGYVYNDGPDGDWGNNPPAFFIDFFSGPVVYVPGETFTDVDGDGEYTDGVDTPLDTAHSIRGQVLGIKEYPGAKNMGLSSFIHYMNDNASIIPDPDNKEFARNYMEGKMGPSGETPDPCDWTFGEVFGGVDCETVDPRFWYSGDPVTQRGWITTSPQDQRMLSNTGPFTLKKGEEKEVMVAYVVGQGADALGAITEARRIDDGAQFIFDNNFLSPSPPPAVDVTVETNDDFIDLIWETPEQVDYTNLTDAYELYFEGYNVWTYKSNTTQPVVGTETNLMLLRRYSLDNAIEDIYVENANTGGIEPYYEEGSVLLDPEVYTDPESGRIRLRISTDPWTGGNLIKGKPYYFAVTSYALNYMALINKETGTPGLSDRGDYYLTTNAFVGSVENPSKIIEVVVGEDIYAPPVDNQFAELQGDPASGKVSYDIVNKELLTGDSYKVEFEIDSSLTNLYLPYWRLTNTTKGVVLADSQKTYLYGDETIPYTSYDGFIVKIDSSLPTIGEITPNTSSEWYDPTTTEFYYVSEDVQSPPLTGIQGITRSGNYLRANKLRNVEIRFGTSGKAYRYVSGYIGTALSRRSNHYYATAITDADTVGKGTLGKFGEGFVDVPFTAWVKDDNYGEERQLAVAFLEKTVEYGGNPDGIWDPGTDVSTSGEYIVVFNTDYDPNGNQVVYTYTDGTEASSWANLRGYSIPETAPVSSDDRNKAASTLFDALYVVGISKSSETSTYANGDIFTLPVTNYPYTPNSVYSFETKAQGALTSAEEKELFDKVNVFPNPLFGFNPATSWTGQVGNPDEPFVTFSNLPEEITIKIYSLSGQLLRTLDISDKDSPTSPFLRWDLTNQDGLRVASGLYLAIVSSPKYGDKVLKFSIVMPQKQLQKY